MSDRANTSMTFRVVIKTVVEWRRVLRQLKRDETLYKAIATGLPLDNERCWPVALRDEDMATVDIIENGANYERKQKEFVKATALSPEQWHERYYNLIADALIQAEDRGENIYDECFLNGFISACETWFYVVGPEYHQKAAKDRYFAMEVRKQQRDIVLKVRGGLRGRGE